MLWPSWLTSVPSEFGSAGYGKLKADLGVFWVSHSSQFRWFVSGLLLKQEIPVLRDAAKSLMWLCRSPLLLPLLVLESRPPSTQNSTWITCIPISAAWRYSSLSIPCIQIIIWPSTFLTIFYFMALSIPGGHSLLSDSSVYFSASLPIIRLVSSITYCSYMF